MPSVRSGARRTRRSSKAARTVALSPAAFSDAIARLERSLDTVLFERTTRSVRLTASGERLDRASWEREVARRGVDVAAAVFPFGTTPEMERWVEDALSSRVGDDGLRKLTILQQELFSPDFGFSYDTDLTLTAAEAFGSRRGNCLSFTSMFVAMARSAGIPTVPDVGEA